MARGTRALGWAGLAALALLALVLLASRLSSPREAREGALPPPERPAATERSLEPSGGALGETIETPRVSSEPAGAGAVREGLPVLVVGAEDRRPVGGARVLYFDSGAVDRLAYEEFLEVDQDLEPVVARFGREFRADASGRALVPFPRGAGSLGAEHAGLWARRSIDASTEGEVVLELAPDLGLDVRLVDARGEGVAGAMVTLQQRFPDGRYYLRGREWTSPGGRARFANRRQLRELARENALELFAGAAVLATEPVQVHIDPLAWPEEEVVLALGETGDVSVELVQADGSPWNGPAEVELALAHDQLGRLRAAGRETPVTSVTTEASGGAARFARVGLGLELTAFARTDGWKQHALTFTGPARAGEVVVARVVLSEPAPSIRGRLVTRAGEPLGAETLTCELRGEKEVHPHEERRRTDAAGRFAGFGGTYLLDEGSWQLFFSIRREPRLGARIELPGPLRAETLELGDVVLDLPPLLASGIVVDRDGQPVRAARITCEESVRHGVTGVPFDRVVPWGAFETGTDGRFELRSWTAAESLRLTVESRWFVSSSSFFVPPREDWRIVLERGGAIAGRVLSPHGHPRDLVDLQWSRADGWYGPKRGIQWSQDGSFRFDELGAGDYRVTLRLWNSLPGEVAWPVEVRAGATTELPPIDLERLLHELAFEVIDAHGAGVPDVTFAFQDRKGARLIELRPTEGPGDFHVLRVLEPLHRLRISAPGFRAMTLEDVSRGARVVLERGPRVRLVLDGGLPALPAPWSLHARPVQDELWEPAAAFDARGTASLELSGPGRFHVGIELRHGAEPGTHGVNGLDWWIDVADEPGEQVLRSPPFGPAFLDELERLLGG